jgi:hypothetical protein
MKWRKGQYFSLDAVIASLIFILMIISLLSYWYAVKSAMERQDSELMKEAFRVSDLLFTPQTSEGPCKIGFSDSWNYKTLNYTAIKNCETLTNTKTGIKSKLGTGYDTAIGFTIVEQDSGVEAVTLGTIPDPASNKEIAKVQRNAAIMVENYDGSKPKTFIAKVEVYLYR